MKVRKQNERASESFIASRAARRASVEMAMPVPSQADYDLMKQLFPTPNDLLTYPEPEELARQFTRLPDYVMQSCYQTGNFILKKGVASYRAVYEHAVIPLRELLAMQTLGDRLSYLVDFPIFYKKDKNEEIMNCLPGARACLGGDTKQKQALKRYVALCFSNLSEWFYLSSNPAYHYLRDYLLEQFRYLRREINADAFVPKGHSHVHMRELPQRATTSRSRGENETELYTINAGYRIVDDFDPDTGEFLGKAVQLILWFYHDAKTQRAIFTDYFDIEENDVLGALEEMRKSDLYRGWVRKFTPKQYENACCSSAKRKVR